MMKKQRAAGDKVSPASFVGAVEVIFSPHGGGLWRYIDADSSWTIACICKASNRALRQWLNAAVADVSLGKEALPVPVLVSSTSFRAKLRDVTEIMDFTYVTSVQLPASAQQHKLPPSLLSKQQCNDQCQRVLRGRQVGVVAALCEGKGWGVLAAQRIERGEFVGEYTGELVSTREMRRRYQECYDPKALNYVLSLREHAARQGVSSALAFDVVLTNVDASGSGNLTRLMNHSCSPNVEVAAVRVDSFVPRLALFALSRIDAGDEISFDYGGGSVDAAAAQVMGGRRCRCGARECRGYLLAYGH